MVLMPVKESYILVIWHLTCRAVQLNVRLVLMLYVSIGAKFVTTIHIEVKNALFILNIGKERPENNMASDEVLHCTSVGKLSSRKMNLNFFFFFSGK